MASKGQRQELETSKNHSSIERPEKEPLLRVVQPPSPSITPRIEVDFKYLDDGRVVELVEDPADATKTKLAVFDTGNVYLTDAVEYAGQLLVPVGRTANGLEDISLPRAPRPYESAEEVFYRTHNLIVSCVAIPNPYSLVTAAIVLNSWFADRLRPPVYLLLTGLPQSGKPPCSRCCNCFAAGPSWSPTFHRRPPSTHAVALAVLY